MVWLPDPPSQLQKPKRNSISSRLKSSDGDIKYVRLLGKKGQWEMWYPQLSTPSPAHSHRPLRGLEQKSLKLCVPLSARISSPLLVLWILFSSSLASFCFSSSTWKFFLTSSSDCFSSRTIAFTLWVTPCSLSVSPVTIRNACYRESH